MTAIWRFAAIPALGRTAFVRERSLAESWASAHSERAEVFGEAPLVDFKDEKDFEAWLRKQPREVAIALAARAALRVLPVVRGTYIVLAVFRAAGIAWAAAKYPAQATSFVARTADARAAAAYVAWDPDPAAAATRAAAAYDDATYDAVFAAAAAAAAAAVAIDATAAFWSAISTDATRVEEFKTAPSVIAGSPLWSDGQPERLKSLWEEIKQTLHAAMQDWELWTIWYEDRLDGRVREEDRELAYVRIGDDPWKHGPAVVNAEIKKRIAELELNPQLIEATLEKDRIRPTSGNDSDGMANTVSDLSKPVATQREDDGGDADIKRIIEPQRVPPRRDPVSVETQKRATDVAASNRFETAKLDLTRPQRPIFKGFFSYTHRDAEVDPNIVAAFSSELERRVDAKLVNARFEIWRDKEKLQLGDYWDQRIGGAIDSSHIFIVLLTPKWISSDYCRREFEAFEKIETARNSGGYVIPIYTREIERQAKFLEDEQKDLLDRLKRIQYQQIIPKQFARLSDHERIDLIEGVADPICDILDRLRG